MVKFSRMKTQLIPFAVLLLSTAFSFLATPSSVAAIASKYTADYYLSTPDQFEGKTITLDVSHLNPARSKSPIPEIQLFGAATWDKQQYLPGGWIHVAVPKSIVDKVVKTYGTNMDSMSRNPGTSRLKGILRAVGTPKQAASTNNDRPVLGQMAPNKPGFNRPHHGGHGGPMHRGGPGFHPYFVDYEGLCGDIIKAWIESHKGQSPMDIQSEGFDTPEAPQQQ